MNVTSLLVPVDYSDHAAAVLGHAAGFARQLGAKVHALHVWECMPSAPPGMKVVTDKGPRLLTELLHEQAEQEMNEFLKRAWSADVAIAHEVRSGDPVKAIIDAATAGKHQLIVMGTHGRTGLSRVVLGSVAEKVLRTSPVPVLTIPLFTSA